MTYSIAVFIALAVITLGAAVAVVTLRNVFHAALMLVVAFFGVAGFYAVSYTHLTLPTNREV